MLRSFEAAPSSPATAPAAIQASTSATWSGRNGLSGGIAETSSRRSIAHTSKLSSGLPGTMAGPDSPPAISALRVNAQAPRDFLIAVATKTGAGQERVNLLLKQCQPLRWPRRPAPPAQQGVRAESAAHIAPTAVSGIPLHIAARHRPTASQAATARRAKRSRCTMPVVCRTIYTSDSRSSASPKRSRCTPILSIIDRYRRHICRFGLSR